MAYQWGINYYKTPAEEAGKVFKELEESVGLTARNLVDASRPEEAPLHKEFEWNDDIAAEKYREDQARKMIQALKIIVDDVDAAPVRAFVNIGEPTYEDIHIVISDDDKRQRLFASAMRELNMFRHKYSALEVFDALFREIDRLEKEI